VQYNFSYGLLPRHISILQAGNLVDSFTDNTGLVLDSLAAGIYTVHITSPALACPTVYALRIADSGVYPNMPAVTSPVYYCKNDVAPKLQAGADTGAVIQWYDAGKTALPGPPTPRTDTTGIFTWYLSQRFKACESLQDSIKVYVTERPVAAIEAPPSICLDDTATISFSGTAGVGPILNYVWDWGQTGYVKGSGAGPWRLHWFDPGVKVIKLFVEENKCVSAEVAKSILVKPVPFAGFDAREEVCQFDTLRVTYNTKPYEGQQFAWNFDGADTPVAAGPGPYILRWPTAGVKRLSLTASLDGCLDTRNKDITVRPIPGARINNAPGPVCLGDKIFLSASGGGKYAWFPKDSIRPDAEGRMYAQILKPVVYRVIVTSEYGCVDSAAISYSVVEPCCNFAYPNAFTPNGDGRNDRFRIVTYGNHLEYELSIYNNWGQRVYYGLDAREGWDGTFNGNPCSAGTYYYYLNAKCFTNKQESHKGTVMLVR
jgi:gliding motility-associated-like protein